MVTDSKRSVVVHHKLLEDNHRLPVAIGFRLMFVVIRKLHARYDDDPLERDVRRLGDDDV